jgi:hypothetical protein
MTLVVLSDLVVSVLAIEPDVRWFKPCRVRWILKGHKSPQNVFLLMGSKVVGSMS